MVCSEHGPFFERDKFAFSSETWDQCDFKYVELKTVHRQLDRVFINMLNKIRMGLALSGSEERELRTAGSQFDVNTAIKLCTRRHDADMVNGAQLRRLGGYAHSFKCRDTYYWNKFLHPELEDCFNRIDPNDIDSPFVAYSGDGERHRMDDIVTLKIGMPVILLTNVYRAEGLANGSQGRIITFENHDDRILPRMQKGSKDHSQFGEVLINGRQARHQEDNIRRFAANAESKRWPVVQFSDGQIVTIYPHCEVQELGVALNECTQEHWSLRSRTQIPLLPGWGITIHKSQGMTLDRAVVDLFPAWEAGQAYTAMSRVRSLDGLKIASMGDGKAMTANEVVKQFYREKFSDGGNGSGRR